MTDAKVNINKVLSTISDSNNGELFDALIAGDIERAGNNAETAAKTVIGRLAWYLAGDKEAVADVFASTALADKVNNPGALIVKACESLKSTYSKSASFFGEDAEEERPARGRRGDDEKADKIGLDDVIKWLNDNNVKIRYNLMTHESEYDGLTSEIAREVSPDNLADRLPNIIYSQLKDDYRTISESQIASCLATVASLRRNQYHPVIEYLNSLPAWDGKDRFPELWTMMRLTEPTEDNIFSQRLVKTWMRQCIALLHNGENGEYFGAQGVLTLSGGQRCGKTNLLRAMAVKPAFFGESQRLSNNDKDTERRCLQYWITELGELDYTFKSETGYLKGVITRQHDAYRLPYARTDTKHPRMTSLGATVNGDKFLVDPTGNSRYWTVQIKTKMDIEGILSYDFGLLWAQTIAEIKASGKSWATCYLLSPADEDRLNDRNRAAEKGLKSEDEIADILSSHGNRVTWEWTTVTKFKTDFADALRSYSAEQIGAALKKLGVESKKMRLQSAGGNVVKAYRLPSSSNSYYLDMHADETPVPAPQYDDYTNRPYDDNVIF